jgi:hypothetical protein
MLLVAPRQAVAEGPRPSQGASPAFWERWSDGQAELDGYRVTMPRYGEPRDGHVVLVYVTEEMNQKTLVKDDTGAVPPDQKEVVLKLNHTLKFRTGIYPYSVMTSVFSPVGSAGRERFAPVKISFTAQEWCGHVFQMVTPTLDAFSSILHSYFSVEGDREDHVTTEPLTLYEDALWIQLRELDGPFEGGGDWEGYVVPSLWQLRKTHRLAEPVKATITREEAEVDGTPITRFTLRYADYSRTWDIEGAEPHRILAWRTSDGEEGTLTGTVRLPYWQLNANGDERYLAELGLSEER